MNVFRWLVCHDCGNEFPMSARQVCDGCGAPVHEKTNLDGALPTTLPKHSEACSNQNTLDPAGAFRGAAECGCQSTELTTATLS